MTRAFLLTVLMGLLTAPCAWADDGPIATATGLRAPQASAEPPSPLRRPDLVLDDGVEPVRLGPCGPQVAGPDGKPDLRAHGEVEAGIGTHGYRHVGLHVCKPVNDDSAFVLNASDTEFDGPRGELSRHR